jgi:hypothetical protein
MDLRARTIYMILASYLPLSINWVTGGQLAIPCEISLTEMRSPHEEVLGEHGNGTAHKYPEKLSRKTVNQAGMPGVQPISALGDRLVFDMIDIPAYQAPTGARQASRLRKFSPEPIRQG